MTEIKTTFLNLKSRHISGCKNYKDEKAVYDQLLSQFENNESFEALKCTSGNLHQLVEGHIEISHDTMLLVGLSIDQLDETQSRLDKTELELKEIKVDLKETKVDLKETKDKLDKMEVDLKETKDKLDKTELYLTNTTNILKETKERLGNELREKRTELKKTQDELKDTKAMTKLLSVYRDWIGIFNRKLKRKLGENTFNEIKEAFDDAKTYQIDITQYPCVKKLEEILGKVEMSFKDFKLLYETKQTSNEKFHKDPNQTAKDAKERLVIDSFPEDQKNLVISLTKLFNALEAWDPRR